MKKNYNSQSTRLSIKSLLSLVVLLAFTGLSVSAQERYSKTFDKLQNNKSRKTNLRQGNVSANVITPIFDMYHLQGDYVTIDATVAKGHSPEELLTSLEALGLKYGSYFGAVVSGMMPLKSINNANMNGVLSLRYMWPSAMKSNIGTVTSQADEAQLSDEARKIFAINGAGSKVGILSDSYDNLNGADNSVSLGDLPGAGNPNGLNAPVDVLLDLDEGGSDEGRAMAEIVHDVAPGAEIAFSSAFVGGQAGFANGILALAEAGSNVIVDDVVYFAEPMFQDGIVAQAADSVNSMGIPYFSSAGNSFDDAFDATFTASGEPILLQDTDTGDTLGSYVFHDFAVADDSVNTFLPLTFPGSFTGILNWSDPFASNCLGCPGASTDLDFFIALTDGDITSILFNLSSLDNNIGNDAFELINVNAGVPLTAYLLIGKKVTPNSPEPEKDLQFKIINLGSATIPYNTEVGGTSFGHANAAGAIAVGAARYTNTPDFGVNPPLREVFSSSGGIPIFFDKFGNPIPKEVRLKPEITAPQGANTSFFGNDFEGDGFPNFFGTSSSAPHAAGVAALMLEQAELSPDEVEGAMISTALDMNPTRPTLPAPPAGTGAQFDFDTGFGLLRASNAVAEIASTPTVLSLLLVDTETGEVISKLEENSIIDLATLPANMGRVSILAEAVAGRSMLGSVRFKLRGPRSRFYVDNKAPYYLMGDAGGKPRSIKLFAGDYSVQATPFTFYNGTGIKGNEVKLNFSVINSAVVESYTVINADTDEEIALLGDTLDLATLETKNINLRANVSSPNVERVVLKLSGEQFRYSQNVRPPFSLFPNFRGDYRPWVPRPRNGDYMIEATTFTSRNFFGTAGETTSFSFTVINSDKGSRGYNFKTGLEESISGTAVEIYPNPSTNAIEVSLPEGKGDLYIMDAVGQVIIEKQLDSDAPQFFHMAQYGTGVYILQFNTESGEQITERIMIVK